MSEANKQLMQRWFEEVWNQQNAASIDALFPSDGVAHGFPQADSVLTGPEDFKTIHRNFCATFPDIHVTLVDTIAEGDKVAAHWTATMTHLGDALGMKPTGKKVVLGGSIFVVVKDGKIIEGWNYMDMGGLFAQLKTA
jgi:steroid delta-isomerase-like uncharacterized protein